MHRLLCLTLSLIGLPTWSLRIHSTSFLRRRWGLRSLSTPMLLTRWRQRGRIFGTQ